MRHAHYDQSGIILGFYDDSIHESIPDPSIELTDAEWVDCVQNSGLRRVDTATLSVVIYTPPPPSISSTARATLEAIKQGFDASLEVGFTCVNGIKMDASMEDVRMLDDGWRLATRLGAASLDVRDYNNVRHMATPLATVEAMVNELGANWLAQWTRKCERDESVQAIVAANALPPSDPSYMDDATARAAIEAITW